MPPKGFDPKYHKRCFLLWASGMTFDAIASLPGYPTRWTLLNWSKPDFPCGCGWHDWKTLKLRYTPEQVEALLKEESLDLPAEEPPETSRKLQEFIYRYERELRPIMRKLREVFGVRVTGQLTGHLHADMIFTGYLLILKIRESIVNIEINDAYQLIQLMRTVISLFKEWPLPSVVQKEIEETIEIKLAEADRPTLWKSHAEEAKERVAV